MQLPKWLKGSNLTLAQLHRVSVVLANMLTSGTLALARLAVNVKATRAVPHSRSLHSHFSGSLSRHKEGFLMLKCSEEVRWPSPNQPLSHRWTGPFHLFHWVLWEKDLGVNPVSLCLDRQQFSLMPERAAAWKSTRETLRWGKYIYHI